MELIEIVEDIARARGELAALTDLSPARLQLCHTVINDLEDEIENTLLKPWIPRTYDGVQTAILATMQNMEQVEAWIAEAGGPMLQKKIPDEMWRFNLALLTLATLRFQLDVLFEAAAALIERMPPQPTVD